MVTHPNFVHRVYRNDGAAQRCHASREAIDSAEVYGFKDKKIARTNEMTTSNPTLHFFLSFWR